jgi:hypothetical protein
MLSLSTLLVELTEAPLGALRCFAVALVMCVGIYFARGVPIYELGEPVGTGLILFGTAWTAAGLRITPQRREQLSRHAKLLRQQGTETTAPSPTDLHELQMTASEMCEALLAYSRLSAQGTVMILAGACLVALNIVGKVLFGG